MRKFQHEVPGPFAIFFQILSGAVFGLLVAGVYLALKPVKAMDAQAAAKAAQAAKAADTSAERNLVTYVPGNAGNPNGQQWRLRERAFLEKAPAGASISEEDINRWMAATYGSQDRKVELKSYDFTMIPGLPIFRVNGSEFQVGMEFVCSVGKASKPIIAQARGHFEKQGDRHVFVPTTVYLGSCPLPGRLGVLLVEKLSVAYPAPENVAASWKSVTAARVEENRLKLAFN